MTLLHYTGAFLVLLLITLLGWYSGSKVKTAHDFVTGGRRAGAGIVAGAIIGSLVGGASTIGTAQLAFTHGLSAWWFTLGSGMACILLGGVYAKPLRESNAATLPQILRNEYGQTTSTLAALLNSTGDFLSVMTQILSSIALITSISALPVPAVTVLTILIMTAYVIFGGVWGTGIVGIAKTLLLALSVGLCGLAALLWQGGAAGFFSALPAGQYFSLVTHGPATNLGAAFSMIVGVLSTQAYFQAVNSARNLRLARAGAFAAAFFIPLIGMAGVLVGLYMRIHFPDIPPAGALPLFVLEFVPPIFGGMILATLFIAVVGTAAGVSLGLSSVLCNDIYCVYKSAAPSDKRLLFLSRLLLVAILAAAGLFAFLNTGSHILIWSILAMALRGGASFGALTFALFGPGRISAGYAVCSILAGPAIIIFGKPFINHLADPLPTGLAVSLLVLLAGYLRGGSRA